MKTLRNLITTATTGLLLTGLALNFNACTEGSPLQSGENEAGVSNIALAKGKSKYPEYISKTFTFQGNPGSYQGGNMNVPGGSSFQLSCEHASIRPHE